MSRIRQTVAIVATAFLITACGSDNDKSDDKAVADTIYRNGNIHTVNDTNERASAIAIDDGIIIGVGSDDDIDKLAGDDTKVVDLEGKTMIPGIYDAHSHFSATGIIALYNANLNSPPIGDIESIDDIVNLLSEKAATTPEGQWITGFGYDDSLIAEKRHPTRYDLDRVSTKHPIVITHISGHLSSANC